MYSHEQPIFSGELATNRLRYLQKLVTEYQETYSEKDKTEVLANLANFSYDSSNFDSLRQLKVIDLFIDAIVEGTDKQISFATGGLCNLSLDPINRNIFYKKDIIPLIINCLSSHNEEITRNSLTTLIYLMDKDFEDEILTQELFEGLSLLSTSLNPCVSNLARVFLDKFFAEKSPSRNSP